MQFVVSGSDLLNFADRFFSLAIADFYKKKEDEDVLYSLEKILELLGASRQTLWRWGHLGLLVPVKVGNKVMYYKRDVDNLFGKREG